MKKGKFYIGTSGWHYDHWKGPFYPPDLSSKNYLAYYSQRFKTVEINRTFYSLPAKKVFLDYAKKIPSDFIFSVKASRFITHVKYLKNAKSPLRRFFSRVQGLENHLGPILFQLPPRWKLNIERLEAFLNILPKDLSYVFEFRNQSWMIQEVFALLKKYRVGFCIYELGHQMSPAIATTDFVYVRLHGPGAAYEGKYPLSTLKKWAHFFQRMAKEGKDVYCYFDNDMKGYAPINAKMMNKLCV